jgi:hypothetical protein
VEKVDSNNEFQFLEPLRRRGFRLHRRGDGMYEIFKGDVIRMTGANERQRRIRRTQRLLPKWVTEGLIRGDSAAGLFRGAFVLAPSPANDSVRDRQPDSRHDFSARSRLDGALLIELDIIVARQGSGRKPRPDLCAFQAFDNGRRIIDLPRTALIIVEAVHDPGNAHTGRYCLGIGDGLFVGHGRFYLMAESGDSAAARTRLTELSSGRLRTEPPWRPLGNLVARVNIHIRSQRSAIPNGPGGNEPV